MPALKYMIIVLALLASSAKAELLGSYYADLGWKDYRNSSGVRLNTVGQVLQQDRANVHRFGIWQEFDQSDPFFRNAALRARIPELYAAGPRLTDVHNAIRSGRQPVVYVMVCGYRGVPEYLIVHFGDGGLRAYC